MGTSTKTPAKRINLKTLKPCDTVHFRAGGKAVVSSIKSYSDVRFLTIRLKGYGEKHWNRGGKVYYIGKDHMDIIKITRRKK